MVEWYEAFAKDHPYILTAVVLVVLFSILYAFFKRFTMTDEEAIDKFNAAVFKDDPKQGEALKRFLFDD